jgi:DNA topoisomerase IB
MTQIEHLQRHGYKRNGSARDGFRFAGAPPGELPRLRALRLRGAKKYDRLLAFGRALPRMRKAIDRGMRLPDRRVARIVRNLKRVPGKPGDTIRILSEIRIVSPVSPPAFRA